MNTICQELVVTKVIGMPIFGPEGVLYEKSFHLSDEIRAATPPGDS